MLPHYLAKCKCSTIQLYSQLIQFKMMQRHLITANVHEYTISLSVYTD